MMWQPPRQQLAKMVAGLAGLTTPSSSSTTAAIVVLLRRRGAAAVALGSRPCRLFSSSSSNSSLRFLPSGRRWLHAGRRSSSEKPLLRPYQEECIASSLAALNSGVRRQAVSLPVGSGKTVIFSNLIPRVPSPSPQATLTLVLAHRAELLDQAALRIRQSQPHLRVVLDQGATRLQDVQEHFDVVVASVPTLGRADGVRLREYDPARFRCIIIDEAHHAVAETYVRILNYFGALSPDSHICVWGCSATLRRHDGIALGAVFQEVTFERNVMDMWKDGWLCQPKALQVQTGTALTGIASSGGDFVLSQLAQATNTPARNKIIVDSWLKHCHDTGRKSTLVFCANVKHTHDLAAQFKAHNVDARVVTGATPADERSNVLEEFRLRRFPVLLNCTVFTEGTDVPCIDSIIMARPTKSQSLFQQMIGRGLRLYPGKEDCLVLDIVDVVGLHSIVTTPTLMGLRPTFDTKGEDLVETAKSMANLTKECPAAAAANSLAEARAIVAHHNRMREIVLSEHEVDIATSEPDALPRALQDNTLQFYKFGSDFTLSCPTLGHVNIIKQPSGTYVAELLRSDVQGQPAQRILESDSAVSAMNGVRTYLATRFPGKMAFMRKLRSKKMDNEAATEKQMQLLKRLRPQHAHSYAGLSKGAAAALIDNIFAARRLATLRKKAAAAGAAGGGGKVARASE
eukprot:m.56953 g.56953  ORF g.56953 m.56953 type:complete len:685 (-) comp13425_c0_seq1:164-2218(-)